MTTICFIGAGSVEFTRDLVADILSFPELAGSEFRLHDIDQTRLDTARGVAESVARQLGAHPIISTHLDRREAITGARFVVNMVQVGGLAATKTDFQVPARFGLRQTIADTLGIGSIFRGLRTFPLLRGLAEDIRQFAPDALLLNYTNPMAMNVGYLSRIAPDVKAFGLCHSVFWTIVGLSEVMGVPHEEVSWRSAGVNHQAWVLSMQRGGQDLYPLLDAKIRADPELRRRVRVDMYRRLGYYPTETSEHSSEYVAWYLKNTAEIQRLRIPVDAYIGISEENVATFEATKKTLAAGGEIPIDTEATEYAPQVIHSVVTGTQRHIQVNTANTGLITNLPAGAPVEVTASVDERGVHPWYMGELPPQCAALNRGYLNVVDLTIHAALTEDPRAIRHAAMLDPNAAATLTVDQIWELCDAMVTAHGDLLPAWARQSLSPQP
ncbi:alpha-glucosidase/alpha-galactosidase [Rathayibacter soli]|uniref:alpha-glucosidase/alpha-galactosidase n=1 Tax=Rathayibacter soli TaxID=3144168 RepID=UPI0027E426CD|nr:alpha-glucosidase/alpha-galactosidase [Glaciibacter superstes]